MVRVVFMIAVYQKCRNSANLTKGFGETPKTVKPPNDLEFSIHLSTRLPEFYRFSLHPALQRLGF